MLGACSLTRDRQEDRALLSRWCTQEGGTATPLRDTTGGIERCSPRAASKTGTPGGHADKPRLTPNRPSAINSSGDCLACSAWTAADAEASFPRAGSQQGTQLGFVVGWVRGSRALRRPVSPPGDGAGMPAPWLLRTDTPTPLAEYRHRLRRASRGEPGDVVGCAARREPQPPSGDPGASDDGVDAALNAVVACPARCVPRHPRPALPSPPLTTNRFSTEGFRLVPHVSSHGRCAFDSCRPRAHPQRIVSRIGIHPGATCVRLPTRHPARP